MNNYFEKEGKKYPEGHFVGIWMAIGTAVFTAFGIPLAIISENTEMIGIGPGLGVAVGLSIGLGIENKYKKEGKIRPLTEGEKKRKKMAVLTGIALFTLGTVVFLMLFFSNS